MIYYDLNLSQIFLILFIDFNELFVKESKIIS